MSQNDDSKLKEDPEYKLCYKIEETFKAAKAAIDEYYYDSDE
jgi:hypothetical protein